MIITFSYVIVLEAIRWLISIVQFLIFARAIASWFPMQGGNPIYSVLVSLTEPIVGPVRVLLSRSSIGNNQHIDLSIFITYLLLEMLKSIIR
jgi:YggT family protein